MNAIDVVQDALNTAGSRGRGSAWTCPVHEDRNASLSVNQGNKGAVLMCHAGCETPLILNAIGLTENDLFDEELPHITPVEAEYKYTDEFGTLLFVKERRAGKKFLAKKPSPVGGWSYKLGDVQRVLYNLPEVANARDNRETIYIVEGEKDADTLIGMGYVATTNFDGAGKWKPEYNQYFAGLNVVIIPDNDEPGLAHAELVEKNITSYAKSVEVKISLFGKDITDHVRAGHGLDELVTPNATKNTPAAEVDPYDLDQYVTDWDLAFSAQPTEIQWLYEPLIERGTANVIYSDAGVGKSLVSLELAASIAQTEVVIYVDSENRTIDHVDRLGDMGYGPDKLRNKLIMVSFPMLPALDTALGGEVLLRYAKKKNAAMVIIDTTMRFVDGKENDADTFNAMYRCTMLPLKGAGITTLRLDHEGKDASRGQRGSSGKRGDVDSVWRLTHPQQGGNRWLDNEKSRTNHYPDKIRLEIVADPLAHVYHWDRNYMDPTRKIAPIAGMSEDAKLIQELGATSRRKIQDALVTRGVSMGVERIEAARAELGYK